MNRKVIDIDDYLPFKSTEEILAFCNPDESLYKEKKAALKERIYSAGDTTTWTSFVNGIVGAIFDYPLLGTYKWPYKRYFIIVIILKNKVFPINTFIKYCLTFFNRLQSNGKKNWKKSESEPTMQFIPDEICFLIEISLLSLVGAEKLSKEFCGENVFSRIRTKFNNAIGNAKKVSDIHCYFFFFGSQIT